MTKVRLNAYLNSDGLGVVHAADIVIVEEPGASHQVGFRYRADYLATPNAFPIDPAALPLSSQEVLFPNLGGLPAFLDDYLPDAWGRQVLTHLAFYRDRAKLNANSVIDILRMMGSSHIGALAITPEGEVPRYDNGSDLSRLADIEAAAYRLQDLPADDDDLNELGLLYLGNHGSGVGGARPKALLHEGSEHYLGKFNHSRDSYNNARVELACLRMAQAAGIHIESGRVVSGINGREVLLLNRFDLTPNGYRNHLITVNGLLKDPNSQRDHGGVFRYDDIKRLIDHLSIDVKADSEQLLRLMLFNRAIHNTDDHERNFSFIHQGEGYRLAPAYDLVPSLTTGEYHATGYGYQPDPPRPSEAVKLGRVLNLPRPMVARVAEEVIEAVKQWPYFAAQAGVDERDMTQIAQVLRP